MSMQEHAGQDPLEHPATLLPGEHDGDDGLPDPVELREQLETNVETLAQEYFVDPETEQIGGETVDAWNIALGTMTHLQGGNMLLVGEPGTGKTTFANTVAAANTGLPMDLYAKTQIQGHPDVTKEDLLVRPDIGRLVNEGEEETIHQNTVYMPQILVDELNRMPEGKQSIMQEFIRTGVLEHLNDVYSREDDIPFAATVNHPDGGTYEMTPPIRDRFDVSLEFTHGHGQYQQFVSEFSDNLDELAYPEETEALLQQLREQDRPLTDRIDRGRQRAAEADGLTDSIQAFYDGLCETQYSADEKEALIAEARTELSEEFGEHGFEPFTETDRELLAEYVEDVDLTTNARSFLNFLYDEVNISSDGNSKRRSDDITQQLHDDMLAFRKTENGMSSRRYQSIEQLARMTAFYTAEEDDLEDADVEAGIEHIGAVAPYTLAHAVDFTQDYAAEFAGQSRLEGEREEMDLARRLVDSVKEHYDDHREDVKAINNYLAGEELTGGEQDRIDRIATGHRYDHPHMQKLQERVQKRYDGG